MDIIKVCKKHGDLTINDLSIGVYKNKKYQRCKQCAKDRCAIYNKKINENEILNEIKKQKNKDYWANNKDKIKQRRIKNCDPEKKREQHKKYASYYNKHWNKKQKEYRENLSDTYIRRVIQNGDKNIKLMSIPEGMIKLKRSIILARRSIKEITKKELKEKIKNED